MVGFNGILTIVGYLTPNPFYTYLLNIFVFLTHFVDNISKRAWAIFFFFCRHLNGFKYFYLIRIILFSINQLFAHS